MMVVGLHPCCGLDNLFLGLLSLGWYTNGENQLRSTKSCKFESSLIFETCIGTSDENGFTGERDLGVLYLASCSCPSDQPSLNLKGDYFQWVIWFKHRQPLWKVVLGPLHQSKEDCVWWRRNEPSIGNWWQYVVGRKSSSKCFPILLPIVGFLILWYLFGPDEPLLARSPFAPLSTSVTHLQPEAEKRLNANTTVSNTWELNRRPSIVWRYLL